jgi:tetratricopeptide (TPR) repeat protein
MAIDRSRTALLYSAVILSLLTASAGASAQQGSWATSRASELTTQAIAHEVAGDFALARKRLSDALLIDGTYGPAYLELARLREADGDTDEALKVYAAGIERVAGFGEGYAARATLLDRLGRAEAAASDMQNALSLMSLNASVQQRALEFYIRRKAWAAALQVARMIVVSVSSAGDASALRKAKLQVVALGKLADDVDPVQAGRVDGCWERRAIAAIALRLGSP